MRRKTLQVGAFALAAYVALTLTGAQGTGALAQDKLPGDSSEIQQAGDSDGSADAAPGVRFVAEPVVQALPQPTTMQDFSAEPATSLAELVDTMPVDGELSKDMRCLAGAVYFEARGEPLAGQLAVARVVINRAESDNFPGTYCGVVYQRAQFSFVHGGQMPAVNTASPAWHNAVAIARIAHRGLWNSAAADALYFHAAYVKPGWRKTKVARIKSHIFYR